MYFSRVQCFFRAIHYIGQFFYVYPQFFSQIPFDHFDFFHSKNWMNVFHDLIAPSFSVELLYWYTLNFLLLLFLHFLVLQYPYGNPQTFNFPSCSFEISKISPNPCFVYLAFLHVHFEHYLLSHSEFLNFYYVH